MTVLARNMVCDWSLTRMRSAPGGDLAPLTLDPRFGTLQTRQMMSLTPCCKILGCPPDQTSCL